MESAVLSFENGDECTINHTCDGQTDVFFQEGHVVSSSKGKLSISVPPESAEITVTRTGDSYDSEPVVLKIPPSLDFKKVFSCSDGRFEEDHDVCFKVGGRLFCSRVCEEGEVCTSIIIPEGGALFIENGRIDFVFDRMKNVRFKDYDGGRGVRIEFDKQLFVDR